MFTLSQVVRNKLDKPPFIVIHGAAGVGKTSFAAGALNPIFIPVEDGLGVLDVATFPEPKKAEELTMMIQTLMKEDHNYKWLVIDSLTSLEKKLWKDLTQKDNAESIEDVGGGYGKGYTRAVEWSTQLINDLRELRRVKGMGIVLIAHSKVTTFNPPDKSSYDHYTLNVNPKMADFIHTQADIVAYCELEQLIRQEDKGFGAKQGKVTETGNRVLHCYSSNKYTSKNRYGIQTPIPMNWSELMKHVAASMPQQQQTQSTTTQQGTN